MTTAGRWTERDGCKVTWQNVIGGMSGQGGTWRFGSESEAERFAVFASDGFPGMGADDLAAEGFEVLERADR